MKNQTTSSKLLTLSSIALAVLNINAASAQQCQPIVWQDNFDETSLNPNAWEIQQGDGCDQGAGMCGWGNNELQNYQANNISLANGVLTITAKKQRIRGTQYTSGRIRTANMPASGEWTFGRFEARMKVPDGAGMWPAFWMLPSNPSEGWPMSGEIDIFESVGQSANTAYGTIHYGQPWPDNSHTGGSMLLQPKKWSDDFHTYAVEWDATEIRWYVDNMLYSTKTVADVAPQDWPFDGRNQFHLIMNLAVGGNWGGTVDDSALPQTLEVDYVRVFSNKQPNLSGDHLPAPGSTQTYSVINPGTSTSWSVTGGTLSGYGDSVDVTWHASSAGTIQTLTANSGGCEVSTPIYVTKQLSQITPLEDFNGTSALTLNTATGTYNATNGVLNYTRDGASQWDVIAYNTTAIPDGQPFVLGDKVFEIDIENLTPSMVGKEILIQLEDSTVATPSNYPTGRHSKYSATIAHDNGWQTLRFQLAERIDTNTSDSKINALLLLIDPNSFNNDTYVIDNINVLGEQSSENIAPSAAFSYQCNQLSCAFDATSSNDPDGNIVDYTWDFGDNTVGAGATAAHAYAQAGSYTVTLTVTDNLGATNSSSLLVNADNNTLPTSAVVTNVETSTISAGKGKKLATALVTLTNNLGQPLAGAVITGTFTGSWNETATATTDQSGQALLQTQSTLSGGVTVNFCINSVTSNLALDPLNSVGLCQ